MYASWRVQAAWCTLTSRFDARSRDVLYTSDVQRDLFVSS